jgi:hypothetical protein
MINFVRLKYDKLLCLLVMRNQHGQEVEIPIPREVASLISAHLARISEAAPVAVERPEDDALDS